MADKTKIDWADATWNPVTGCLHGCEYCYARRIAKRFCSNDHGKVEGGVAYPCGSLGDCLVCSELDGMEFVGQKIRWNHDKIALYPYGFMPTFHEHRLDVPSRWKRPRSIFVCSMADLFGEWVPDEWIQQVFAACEAAPQHRYLFLTKNPKRYMLLAQKGILPRFCECWYGSSTPTKQTPFFYRTHGNIFLSIEPILEPFTDLGKKASYADWIIVGAETGNRKGKVLPEKSWIMEIVESCKRENVPLFMKESLREIMGANFLQEFPWEV